MKIRNGLLTIWMFLAAMACQAADQASWYGENHRGRLMANGQPFDPDKLTAASWFYDLGTKVVVTCDDRSVVVEITDRGPAKRLVQKGRTLDLSRAAFAKLASPDLGLIDVTIKKKPDAEPQTVAVLPQTGANSSP
jgi:rare lipoprotein A